MKGCYARDFRDFDHSTGMNLPLDDPWGIAKAYHLLVWAGHDAPKDYKILMTEKEK